MSNHDNSNGLNFFHPLFWGTRDPELFTDLMRIAAKQTTAYHFADNMFLFQRNNSMLHDKAFMECWERNAVSQSDRTIIWRRYILAMAAYHCAHLEGDFVECGAYQGVGAKTVLDYLGGPTFAKTFWLYDIFEHDMSMVNHAMPAHGPQLYDEVKHRFADYPNVRILKGMLPEVLAEGSPEKIAYLHLDLNQAPAEIGSLEALFDRVVPGGMIILDDYEMYFYRAQKKAEDEWFAARGYKVFPLPTSQGFVIKRGDNGEAFEGATHNPFLPPPTDDLAPSDQQRYENWRTRTSMQEIDAELLAERMVGQWTKRPGIHLLTALHAGEESLLADTLDSLAPQLYPEWLLTVVTDLPRPEGLDEIPNLQWLSLKDAAHIDYVIDEMAAASPGTWLARIEPGLTLEPQALQVFADYINARPQWRLIYCDEDTYEADGSYSEPLFKPDFNLDLLRAQAYFGSFVLVEKEAFLATGRYGSHGGAENYDLSLRILDQAGPTAIGHVDQMLAHLPRASTRSMQPEAEKQAVGDHLARCGLNAEVFDGAIYGTRRIEYHWPTEPLVSIVIPTREREEYLRPLLDSLQERTGYPNYEIIVVDNDSVDPDTVAYLEALRSEVPQKAKSIRVIPCPGEFSWTACANTGAAAACGDYIVFLDNDIHVVQDEWLGRLMGIAQRPEVAVVAPRLTYPETGKVQQGGWILGLNGSVGNPWDNQLELAEPGYMARALCDQNLSTVGGSAMLVRRSVLTELGGFDVARFPLVHGAVDFCLRAADLGYQIVWTPYSALVHYNGVSMRARQRKEEGRLADLIAYQNNTRTLLERWLPRLAHDPAYNRNLSLIEAYKPEHIAPVDWDLNFHDRPRILAIPVPGGAGEYRLRAPLRKIGQKGLAQTMICNPPKAFTMRILSPVEVARAEPDVLIMHQPLDDNQSDIIESYARHLPGVRRILTMDDLVTELPKKHPKYKSGYKDGRRRLRKNLSFMDRLVVSTQPLADLCADMIDDIRVMPNCLEWSLWGDVQPPRLPHRKPRVGWAGAQQHQGDLELIYPVVEALADEVDWIFMGMCPDALKPFVHEAHDFERDFQAYPRALARLDLDLAIAPLEIHAFNEAKSNLRLLEYGAMGWPVICTDIHPYQQGPVTRLPNDPDLWIRTIREHLAEPEALRAVGLELQKWVHDNFILENRLDEWFDAYGR